MKSRKKGLKYYLSIVAANAGILVLLLLLTEAGLRIAGIPYNEVFVPSENAVARFDKGLGWSYIPNLSKKLKFGSNTREVHFDDKGIRVPSPGHKLSRERPSVLFIGCSFTMGHGLSYEESFAGQFEAMADGKYQAVNLGVQAYGTDQSLLALKKFAPQFNTKAVVYTFIGEHIYRNGNYDRRYLYPGAVVLGTKPLFELDDRDRPYLSLSPVLYADYKYRHSYLFDLLRMKLENQPPYPEKLTRALILEMKNYCEAHGIHFVMINWRWGEGDYHDFSGLPVNMIDSLNNAPEGWQGMLIPGEDHPDAKANLHIARLLSGYFEENSLIHLQQ